VFIHGASGGGNAALVVDDEASVRETVGSILSEVGFRVVESEDGHHALSVLQSPPCFDLLVTETQPPGVDGAALAEQFMLKCPLARSVLLSGDGDTSAINVESNGAWVVIPKRQLADVFLAAIRHLGLGHPRRVILLVDDEAVVRKFVGIVLRKAGYAVIDASDGEEGLELFRAYRDAIDLVVSDLKMPRMTGPELAEHVRRERPGTRVLLMSGYASGMLREYAASPNFLQKPFVPGKLTEKVAELMNRTGQDGITAEM